MIAVVAADQLELADRYAALIAAFGGVALAAIVLVAGGGYFLVRKAALPAERAMAYTRRVMADAPHELRTPLAVLRARAGGALQEPRSPEGFTTALRGMEHQ